MADDDKPIPPTRVVLVDLEIPFLELVAFLVKLALAAVPAAFFVVILYAILIAILGRLGVAFG